jgi:ribonucleotide monophosphatase NagD (HAD superfamily)
LISSIFAINDVSPYETSLQVMHNVLKHHHQESSEPLPFYAAQNDIVWAGGYKKPRMAFGPFNYILQEHCRRHNFHLLACNFFGKPEKKAFSFVEEEMRKVE